MAKRKVVKSVTKKTKRTPYFTKETQVAIKEFKESECQYFRESVYKNKIMPALEKLAENLIYIYGFHKQHDDVINLKHQCVVNLYETLHKFDHTRGSNAFSYFNVVGKNWLIIQSRKRNKRKKKEISIDDPAYDLTMEGLFLKSDQVVESPESILINKEKRAAIREMLLEIKNKLNSDTEKICMDSIITIFDNLENLDFLNKRAIFVYIRELSGLNSKQLSSCMSSIRKLYKQNGGSEFGFIL